MSDALPESCKQPAGKLRPVVDPAKCEGKKACEAICPVDVFVVERIAPDVFRKLPAMAKFKVWAHGMKTATTPNAAACLGCALCVEACPETAIRLLSAWPERSSADPVSGNELRTQALVLWAGLEG